MNINEIGQALQLSQPTVTKHIQMLEQAGLVASEYMPGVQGMQKRCRLCFEKLVVNFSTPSPKEARVEEISMPIGLYSKAMPSGTCGIANYEKIIGLLDSPQAFLHPDRASAQMLWMGGGYVEYAFANDLPTSMEVSRLEVAMEICSEAPGTNPDWPSDITLTINGVDVATWTCPSDLGDRRGLLNPEWWLDNMTQYGQLKIWTVDAKGASIDGSKISEVKLSDIPLSSQKPITVRIGVKPDAEHAGGFNLFGSCFGNYPQDLILRLYYGPRAS